jgi:hypothetical protein
MRAMLVTQAYWLSPELFERLVVRALVADLRPPRPLGAAFFAGRFIAFRVFAFEAFFAGRLAMCCNP